MNFPTGYTEGVIGGAVDYSPGVGIKDCLRRVATTPALMPDAEQRAVQEVERAAIESFNHLHSGSKTFEIVHRIAADRMRVRMIELLQQSHKPPYERETITSFEEAEEPARSRLFNEIETHYVQPIDGNAAVVAGYEPGEEP